jgi:uncharacterized membrane protein YeaQ/YmgE (transglycosylase-associated protein family)
VSQHLQQSVGDASRWKPEKPDWSIAGFGKRAYISALVAGQSGIPAQLKCLKEDTQMGFITWIVVGLIAGWLAGQVMKGGGYGVLVDIILGILGGVLGGWVFGLLGIWPGGGILGAIIVSFVGAVILVAITRLLKRA